MKLVTFLAVVAALAVPAAADSLLFSTGNVTNAMAVATRPSSAGKFEIEGADDFLLTSQTQINSATFTGLLTGGATVADINDIVVEIYRVFPDDSDIGRTSGPPTFSTPQVPTRVNSPSDVALVTRDSAGAELTFNAAILSGAFAALNSIAPGGIHPSPNQNTGGHGAVTGSEVQITANLATPFNLPAGHYFFVPQVGVSTTNGNFLWLSGTRPIVAPGTPFAPDLQAWTRDEFLNPDWLRVGTDIVGGTTPPTFNFAFSLSGTAVPEPGSLGLITLGVVAVALGRGAQRRGGQRTAR
jgi:hypothetical protein